MIKLKGYSIRNKLYESPEIEIYKGEREEDKKPVIIKAIKTEFPAPQNIEFFEHEYKITQKAATPGMVKSHALEHVGHSKVIILDDFDGILLSEYIASQNHGLSNSLQIAVEIIKCIGDLHKKSIIHKDIRPQNIIINPETNRVTITGFGIAAEVRRETQTAVNPEKIEGNLAYISPEQTGRMNRSIDFRSDFYSFGITLYEMLSFQLPFETQDKMELVHSHIAVTPVPPIKINRGIPKAVSNIIMKLLSKTAEERYQGASGIRFDLEKCYQQLNTTGNIEDFLVGQNDISEQFQVPEKLYGRDAEIDHLLHIFERASFGNKEIVFYSGVSGIGKSTLINEMQKAIVEKRGFFISGKFDQYKKNIPYTAVIQAFQGLSRLLLTASEEELILWKKDILKAVGNNGQVIIDVIPGMELILGEQPQVQILPAAEAQNRFNMVFQDFIKVFTKKDHPLVLFLDDLQWADLASLQLLDVLLGDAELSYLLFIGAYRDNEVYDTHPFILAREKMKESGVAWESVSLAPITISDISLLLADTLQCSALKTEELSLLIHTKTDGNPFFVKELIKSLYDNDLVEFKKEWVWDITKINQVAITDNVVELMAEKIKKLRWDCLAVVRIAACIGVKFYLDTLALVRGATIDETFEYLKEAINEGMIVKVKDNFNFVHDRVQEAVYTLISEKEKKQLHYRIGSILLRNAKKKNILEERIFSIVSQLNLAKELVREEEKKEIIELNFRAGRKAKAATAFDAAIGFFKDAKELIPANSWETFYDVTLLLFTEWSEAEYMATNFEEAEELFSITLKNAKNLLDKIEVYGLEIEYFSMQQKNEDAVNSSREALKQLGVSIPKKATNLSVLFAILNAKRIFRKKDMKSLLELPEMTDPRYLAAINIMLKVLPSVYITDTLLIIHYGIKMVELSVKYGNSPKCTYAYGSYGAILASIINDYSGYDFGKLSLQLAEKYGNRLMLGKVYFQYACFLGHWKEHLRNNIEYCKKNRDYSSETGDLQILGYSYYQLIMANFLLGENLSKIKDQIIIKYSSGLDRINQPGILFYFNVWKQTILNLLGESEDRLTLKGDSYNEETSLGIFYETNDFLSIAFLVYNKLVLYYLFGEYTRALELCRAEKEHAEAMIAMPVFLFYHFITALILSAAYWEADKSEKRKNLKELKRIRKKFKLWGENNQYNYYHKLILISAEINRIEGRFAAASELYDEAIRGAHKNGYTQEEAMANECAAKFYLANGNELKAAEYMTEAYYCYRTWGALTKLEDLVEKFPMLVKIKSSEKPLRPLLTAKTETGIFSVSTTTKSEELDLSTILKASQAISGEIVLTNLLEKMIKLAIENAGAQKGILILEDRGKLLIEARGDLQKGIITTMESSPVTASSDIPISIINYVARVKENVLLNDTDDDRKFSSDLYIKEYKPKSVLCVPIVNQGKLSAILYLENNLLTGAFTPERLELLTMLSSQAAISIENARLYANLESTVEERTAALRETRDELWGEMQLAKKIQTVLVPQKPVMEGYEIAASMEPTDEVGGDYYDVIHSGDRNWLVIGDVSGHGVPAGLIMMMVQTAIHVTISQNPELPPSELLTIINSTISANIRKISPDRYMTITVLAESQKGEFIFSGLHEDIFIYRAASGTVDLLETGGSWIGLIDDITGMLRNDRLALEPGDVMLLYTDGITEAWHTNSIPGKRTVEDHMYGINRLSEVFRALGEKPVEDIKQGIVDSMKEFPPHDDVTMVVVKRL
ncbi:MAG: AAA family ATPase [bacterium]|nr:AAA family ATPase [bacterium]